jgi:methylthioribose-1-phosphate isomerase
MKINNQHYHTIWIEEKTPEIIRIIDQRKLPFVFEIIDLKTAEQVAESIKNMAVRGAPLIGVAAAYGIYLALLNYQGADLRSHILETAWLLKSTRPTAINLEFAIQESIERTIECREKSTAIEAALEYANELRTREIKNSSMIGDAGLPIIRNKYNSLGRTVNILTHCNAGWLACIDWGTALAPIYKAFHEGIPLHIWVDETRPRNQGARLTAFELKEEGIPHTVICDNTGGHLMQMGMVDMVIVGSDRTSPEGDVTNKIGTYLKALAAHDNNIPFYAALPSSSFDWQIDDMNKQVPIEERDPMEVTSIDGWNGTEISKIELCPQGTKAANYAFDVTPSHLITGLITERGACLAGKSSILSLFPERK